MKSEKPRNVIKVKELRQGDIVYLPFPYTSHNENKQRPALVISSDWYNEFRRDVILLPLTSQIPPELREDDYRLTREDLNFARLSEPSIIKVGVIMTIKRDMILYKKGRLPPSTVRKIIQKIKGKVLFIP